jgi:hypothetical protein
MILMAPAGPSSQRMNQTSKLRDTPHFVAPTAATMYWRGLEAEDASRRCPRDVEPFSDPYSGGGGAVMDGLHAASELFAGSRVGARDERVGALGG